MRSPATVPAPRQRLQAPRRREAIVDAVVSLFAERGFRGATTRELAAAAGISEPVLYQHFETKRALYSAIIDSKSQEGPKDIEELLAPFIASSDDRGFFTKLADTILDWYLDDPRFIRLLLFSAMEAHDLSDLFYERHVVVYYRTLTAYIERRMKQRAFRRMDPYLAARAFSGMVAHQGLIGAIFSPGDLMADRRKLIDAIVAIFLNGMRRPSALQKRRAS